MESIIPLSATSFLLHLICSLKKQFSATNNHGPAATPGHNGPEKLRLIKPVERLWSRHQWAACEAAAQARAASSCISAASLGCTNLLQRTLLQRWRGGPGPDHGPGPTWGSLVFTSTTDANTSPQTRLAWRRPLADTTHLENCGWWWKEGGAPSRLFCLESADKRQHGHTNSSPGIRLARV